MSMTTLVWDNRIKMSQIMDVKVRHARSEDLEAMIALLAKLFSIESDFAVDPQRQRQGLSLMLDGCGKHRCIMVAEVDCQVAGMVSAQMLISTAHGGMVALVEDLVVDDSLRGKGIGRLLMENIEAWARKQGLGRLQLLADRTNFTALDFYHKIGWRPTGLICLRRTWNKTN